MTDPGQGGQWGQNPYNQPQQPPYGQPQPPPAYGQPQPPPAYGQPQQPPYGQPPQPPYGQPSSGQGPYEQGAYPTAAYPAGTYGPPPYGAGPGATPPSGGGKRKGLMIGSAVVVLAVIAAVVAFALSSGGGGSSGSTPADAAKALLSAGKSGSRSGVTNALCTQDRALVSAALTSSNPLVGSDKLTSYTVGAVTQQDSTHATVKVSYTESGKAPDTEDLPVVKDGSSWKVCFTSELFGSGAPTSGASHPVALPSGLPSDLASDLPSDLPSGLPSDLASDLASDLPTDIGSALNAVCASAATDAIEVAAAYIGLAESGVTQAAQACVYKNSVSAATTAKLAGHDYTPTSFGNGSGPFGFTGDNGSKVTIATSKESDGLYYVTSVTVS